MRTEVVAAFADRRANEQPSHARIRQAVELLQRGEIVALPTETVYGLAGDALRAEAVVKIFEAKGRPRFDPLIVHLPDTTWLERITSVSTQNKGSVDRLAEAFWPGPFTMVLPKRTIVPDLVTGGLDTVAVRISAHPVFARIIGEFGHPIAAPSANRFGRISPTTAQHVADDLNRRIPLIVDGGATTHGIESTIVTVYDDEVEILRRGPVTEEQLRALGFRIVSGMGFPAARRSPATAGRRRQPMNRQSGSDHRQDATPATSSRSDAGGADATRILAPGQLPSHYAPKTPLRLIENATMFSPKKNQRIGLLAWKLPKGKTNYVMIRQLSPHRDLREAAANLFRYLRELDQANLDLILAEQVPEEGLGAAINDRLRRGATKA